MRYSCILSLSPFEDADQRCHFQGEKSLHQSALCCCRRVSRKMSFSHVYKCLPKKKLYPFNCSLSLGFFHCFMLHLQGIRQVVHGESDVIEVDESRTVKFVEGYIGVLFQNLLQSVLQDRKANYGMKAE